MLTEINLGAMQTNNLVPQLPAQIQTMIFLDVITYKAKINMLLHTDISSKSN